MSNMNLNCSNETILNIYNGIKNGLINLAPDFQRKLVWNDSHKENFIDTILKGLPFPEIYIAEGDIDVDNPQNIVKLVVDGQQRLSTIVQYIDGSKGWKMKTIQPFQELSKEEKEKFFYYNIVIRNLGHLPKESIQEIFKKINSVNYALNAIEITNALYDGCFISTANKILEANKEIINRLEIFSITEESRMKDLDFILTLMSLVEENIYFSTNSRNEFYIKEFNNIYDNSENIFNLFIDLFCLINKCVDDSYSAWARKNNFLTLFIELKRYSDDNNIKINEIDANSLQKVITEFERNIFLSKKENNTSTIFYQYYLSSIQGTGSKASRIRRGKILQDFLKTNLN